MSRVNALRASVSRATHAAQIAAAVLVLTCAARFAWLACVTAARARVRTEVPALAVPVDSVDSKRTAGPAPQTRSSAAKATAPGKPVRMSLSVNLGPARSEVYVGGRLRGRTPLIGEISCRNGQPLKLEIVPKQGAAQRVDGVCHPGTWRVTETTGETK